MNKEFSICTTGRGLLAYVRERRNSWKMAVFLRDNQCMNSKAESKVRRRRGLVPGEPGRIDNHCVLSPPNHALILEERARFGQVKPSVIKIHPLFFCTIARADNSHDRSPVIFVHPRYDYYDISVTNRTKNEYREKTYVLRSYRIRLRRVSSSIREFRSRRVKTHE